VLRVLRIVGLMSALGLAWAQTPPAFEAASIKPNHSGSGSSSDNTEHGRLTVTNETVKQLIQMAFNVKDFQIEGGPRWLATERYDIVATTGKPDDIKDAEFRALLQSLLADRFTFRYHRDTKQLTMYSLAVAKGSPKLTEHTGEAGGSSNTNSRSGKTTMTVTKGTMASLASHLEGQTGRIIKDNTGLKGAYDYKLEWSNDQAEDSSLPSLFTALQEQLGLRLDSTKGPVEMIVIDRVERPSEN
jgi:uncharacterized protein (TIGR03435 family)